MRLNLSSLSMRRAAAAFPLAALLALATLLLGTLLTAPAASAQSIRVQGDQATDIISLQARVVDLDTGVVVDYPIQPAENVEMEVGERVRISLVGTAIINGRGVEVDVPASFEVAADGWRIDMAPAGPNSVTVVAKQPDSEHRGDPDSRSQLRYAVRGNYDMKPTLREGRITFDIAPDSTAAPVRPPSDSRWELAQDIASDLAHLRLEERPRPLDDYWVEQIYLRGYEGVREAALALADQATRDGALRRWNGDEVVARLYRSLLHREGSVRELASRDSQGFRSNVRDLRAQGYRAVVENFIESEEFQRVQEIDRLERMERGYDRPRFRTPGDRGADRSPDRRPVPRDTRPPRY